MEILIGDKNLSSWSMRPWLALKRTGAPFTETLIRLRSEPTPANILAAGSPSGLVPVLKDGAETIWDTLAICEYLAERYPAAKLWPADPTARALARAATAEMHSGFPSLRGECPMDLALRVEADVSPATAKDIRRIVGLWSGLLGRFGGPVPAWATGPSPTPSSRRWPPAFAPMACASLISATRARPPPMARACWRRRSSWNGKPTPWPMWPPARRRRPVDVDGA